MCCHGSQAVTTALQTIRFTLKRRSCKGSKRTSARCHSLPQADHVRGYKRGCHAFWITGSRIKHRNLTRTPETSLTFAKEKQEDERASCAFGAAPAAQAEIAAPKLCSDAASTFRNPCASNIHRCSYQLPRCQLCRSASSKVH